MYPKMNTIIILEREGEGEDGCQTITSGAVQPRQLGCLTPGGRAARLPVSALALALVFGVLGKRLLFHL